MDEWALIRLAREGDTEAFRSLFDDHKKKVFSLAYQYLKNAADAEDVLQETFIKAYQALPKYSPDKGTLFSSWISRICVNASIDALRKIRRKNFQALDGEEAAKLSASVPKRATPSRPKYPRSKSRKKAAGKTKSARI